MSLISRVSTRDKVSLFASAVYQRTAKHSSRFQQLCLQSPRITIVSVVDTEHIFLNHMCWVNLTATTSVLQKSNKGKKQKKKNRTKSEIELDRREVRSKKQRAFGLSRIIKNEIRQMQQWSLTVRSIDRAKWQLVDCIISHKEKGNRTVKAQAFYNGKLIEHESLAIIRVQSLRVHDRMVAS